MAQHQRKNAAEQIVTANRLVDGVVVYWSKGGNWKEQLKAAQIASADEAQNLLLEAQAKQTEIVDPYLFEIERENGRVIPASQRERIRALGPTVRLDLGKQAGAK